MSPFDLVPLPYRLAATAGTAALALAGIAAVSGWLYLQGHASGVAAEHSKVLAAEKRTAVAQAQGGLDAAAAAAPAAADRRALQIIVKAEEAAHAVQSAPGASDAVPADVLAGWAAGVDGVRSEAAAARLHGPDDPGSRQPARAVPTS